MGTRQSSACCLRRARVGTVRVDGSTALDAAVAYGRDDVARILRAAGAATGSGVESRDNRCDMM